jgi:SNF2 family DNA or RNA helicase
LKDNSIAVLPEEWFKQYAVLIKHSAITHEQLVVPVWLFLNFIHSEQHIYSNEVFKNAWIEQWEKWNDDKEEIIPIPQGIQASLRSYQKRGFEWMVLLAQIGAGALLADDMGLGKTLQTICFLQSRNDLNPLAKHLIICPASLIYNWKNELEKFAPQLKSFVATNQTHIWDSFTQEDCNLLIISYSILRSKIAELNPYHWDTVIVDESQNIKNRNALISKSVYSLHSNCRIALSGTPIMNNTLDLYAQLKFLLPNMFGSYEFFKNEYALPIDRDGDKDKITLLQKITAPFILRRTKEQVAKDLPEMTQSILWCDMLPDQRAAYDLIKSQIKSSLFLNIKNEGIPKNKLHILAGIMKLRQVCGSPQLLQETQNYNDSVKIDILMQEIKKLQNGSKALVFSQFKGMLHLIADRCKQESRKYLHFDGSTPASERQQIINRFQQEDDDHSLFLISLKSGNAGLNLTSADYVFLIDPWWNTAVQQQAINRTHRIGQTKKVFAYNLICKNSIEERILELQNRKMTIAEEIIGGDEGFMNKLNMEDLEYLFE